MSKPPKTHRETVSDVMDMLNLEYRDFQIDKEGIRLKFWSQMLKGFDPKIIMAAGYHLATLQKDFSPNIGAVREQCVLMANGKLSESTGIEAWEHILKRMDHKTIELTEFEKKALAQTGTINEFRQCKTSDLITHRARYITAFDHLVAKRKLERVTLPEVKALVEHNRLALLAPPKKKLEEHKEPNTGEPEKIESLCNDVVESMKVK